MAQWITVLVDKPGNLSSGLKEKRDYSKLCVYIRAHQRHDKPQVSHPEVVTAAAVEFEWSEEESQVGARKKPSFHSLRSKTVSKASGGDVQEVWQWAWTPGL